jgi:hypothetical protein
MWRRLMANLHCRRHINFADVFCQLLRPCNNAGRVALVLPMLLML